MASNLARMNMATNLTIDGETFKQAMRQLAGGVSVITAESQGQRTGLTVVSVISVSVEPPELLVSINQNASAWPLIKESGLLGVNILGAQHQQLGVQFAGIDGSIGEARYRNGAWIRSPQGVWLLKDAPAAFSCRVKEIVIRHSHALVIAEIEYIHQMSQSTDPLLYWQGAFRESHFL